MNLADLRLEYRRASLDESSVVPDPLAQFRLWFEHAEQAGIAEPNAMTLATADETGSPSSRVVLLKGLDARGFTFFTNYDSLKGRCLDRNPHAALTFFWKELERQVNVRGTVEKVTREESAAYFALRPYASRIGAHASAQSIVIPNRAWLEQRFAELMTRYPEAEDSVPLPDNWGGYRLLPDVIEFWQGRPSRLHDRICFTRDGDAWRIERLSP